MQQQDDPTSYFVHTIWDDVLTILAGRASAVARRLRLYGVGELVRGDGWSRTGLLG